MWTYCWPALSKVNCKDIGCAMAIGSKDVHVFSYEQYVAIHRNRTEDAVEGPYEIADIWINLHKTKQFTNNIDMVLRCWDGRTYCFRGSQCTMLDSSHLRHSWGPRSVRQSWPLLVSAGFYD